MSPEELLKPRYKIIADYPGCPYPVGEILVVNDKGELYSETIGYSFTALRIMESEVDKFRHLVKKLEWWEERQVSEMPQYVKWSPPCDNTESFFKVFQWHLTKHGESWLCDNGVAYLFIKDVAPATEQEYLNFINPQS